MKASDHKQIFKTKDLNDGRCLEKRISKLGVLGTDYTEAVSKLRFTGF